MTDRQRAASASPYEDRFGFSRAVRVDRFIAVSGTAPIEPDGSVTPGDAAAQAERCFAIAADALNDLGASIADVFRTRMYVVDIADADAVAQVHGRWFADIRPAATMVQVAALIDPQMRVEIELDAIADPADRSDP